MKAGFILLFLLLPICLYGDAFQGEIFSIDKKSNSITLSSKKGMKTYRIRPDSTITVNGKAAHFEDLNTGMSAKADSAEPSIATKVTAESVLENNAGNPAQPGAKPISEPLSDADRLVRGYALLKNAEQMAVGGLALSIDDLSKTARAMPPATLKTSCQESVDHTLAWAARAPAERQPDILAYLKNAKLRIVENREENPEGHISWAKSHKGKVADAIHECAKEVTEALAKP
jgi:hypothetical protein